MLKLLRELWRDSYWEKQTQSALRNVLTQIEHEQQIEHDVQRIVGLAQAHFYVGIIAGFRVSDAKIPVLREQCNGLLLQS